MPQELAVIRAKVARAKEQLDGVTTEAAEFCEQAISVHEHFDPATGERIGTIRITREPPAEWPIILGEAGHNLRSALDQLVYRLAVLDGGDPHAERTQFPIFERWADYFLASGRRGASRKRMLKGLTTKHMRVIDGLQPFQQAAADVDNHPLAVLRWLTDTDKHRQHHAAIVSNPRFQFQSMIHVDQNAPSPEIRLWARLPDEGLADGSEVYRLFISGAKSQRDHVLRPSDRLFFEIAFGTRKVKVSQLDRVVRTVHSTVERFARDF